MACLRRLVVSPGHMPAWQIVYGNIVPGTRTKFWLPTAVAHCPFNIVALVVLLVLQVLLVQAMHTYKPYMQLCIPRSCCNKGYQRIVLNSRERLSYIDDEQRWCFQWSREITYKMCTSAITLDVEILGFIATELSLYLDKYFGRLFYNTHTFIFESYRS